MPPHQNLHVQNIFRKSSSGDKGVLINDHLKKVVKLEAFDLKLAVPLDRLGALFGLQTTNAKVVTQQNTEDWILVQKAILDTNYPDKNETSAMIMDFIDAIPLPYTYWFANSDKEDTVQSHTQIEHLCIDLGKMLVMDLMIRNNDRFKLRGLLNELLETDHTELNSVMSWEWQGNFSNILVDKNGHAIPIDGIFTKAKDSKRYFRNTAILLGKERMLLIEEASQILSGYLWWNTDQVKKALAKKAFEKGIVEGVSILTQLKPFMSLKTE